MESKPTMKGRLRYLFDTAMTGSVSAMMLWIAALTLMLAVFAGIVVLITRFDVNTPAQDDLFGEVYYALMHVLDPGVLASDEGSRVYLLLMLALSICGILLFSALIGIVSSAIESRLRDLRRGRSPVMEEGHTLILGWSNSVFKILSELEIAGTGKRPVVVILADRDKIEMDESIRERVGPDRLRVVTRTGSPISLADLAIVRPRHASSVIVLSPGDEGDPDSQVIKSILAVNEHLGEDRTEVMVVAEISDPDNLEAAGLARPEQNFLVDRREIVGRLLAQAARHEGTASVVRELLDFSGHEPYIRPAGSLAGRSFGEVVRGLEESCPVGLVEEDGSIEFCPPPDQTIRESQGILAVAESESGLVEGKWGGQPIDESSIVSGPPPAAGPERIMILGWNRGGREVVAHLDRFLANGSVIDLMPPESLPPSDLAEIESAQSLVREVYTGPLNRFALEVSDVDQADHVIVLAADDPQADSKTLALLLHLRALRERRLAHFTVAAELVEEESRPLGEAADADDLIVRESIIGLLMSQLSQNTRLVEGYSRLFAPGGYEIFVKPALEYMAAGTEVNFATMVEAALRRGECAIGFRCSAKAHDSAANFGITVNPPKSTRFQVQPGDGLVVVAGS